MSTDQDVFASFGLQHDAWGRLVLIDATGARHIGVEPIRGFPISDPEHFISLCDREGRELVCVQDMAKLPAATRQVLEQDLSRREFVPVIERIASVSSGADPTEWQVDTDRGPTTFLLKSEDDVRRLGPDSALVIDSHGLRYLVPDTKKMDAASRRILERYL